MYPPGEGGQKHHKTALSLYYTFLIQLRQLQG